MARALSSLGITVERARAQVVRIVGSGEQLTSGQIPFTPAAKKVLELALREAQALGHNYIGTEHILLGLVRDQEAVGARILFDFDAGPEKIRNEVTRMLSGPGGVQPRESMRVARVSPVSFWTGPENRCAGSLTTSKGSSVAPPTRATCSSCSRRSRTDSPRAHSPRSEWT